RLGRSADAGIIDRASHHQPTPSEKHEDGADHRPQKPCALPGPIPSDRLTEPSGDEGAGDAEQCREYEPGRVVATGGEDARDDTGDKADQDRPDDVHDFAPRPEWNDGGSGKVPASAQGCVLSNGDFRCEGQHSSVYQTLV